MPGINTSVRGELQALALYSISVMGPWEMVLCCLVTGEAAWGVTLAAVFLLITEEMSFLTKPLESQDALFLLVFT